MNTYNTVTNQTQLILHSGMDCHSKYMNTIYFKFKSGEVIGFFFSFFFNSYIHLLSFHCRQQMLTKKKGYEIRVERCVPKVNILTW